MGKPIGLCCSPRFGHKKGHLIVNVDKCADSSPQPYSLTSTMAKYSICSILQLFLLFFQLEETKRDMVKRNQETQAENDELNKQVKILSDGKMDFNVWVSVR